MIGVPLDFRLGFGAAFAQDAEIVVIDVAEPERRHPRPVAGELYGALPATLEALRGLGAAAGEAAGERDAWIASLRAIEQDKRAARGGRAGRPARAASPDADLRRARQLLDRDAIIVGDGGDFVSYAGRVVDSYEPGCWVDPGPYRMPRLGDRLRARGKARTPRAPGRAAARRRRVRLLGDGPRHARAPRGRRSSR